MVTRDGGGQDAGLSAGTRAMHSTDNGHPESTKVCCGPPTLGFELVSGNVGKRGQATANRVSALLRPVSREISVSNGVRGSHNSLQQQTPSTLSSTATGSPPQQGTGANLLETGSLGEGGVGGARGLPGGPGGGNTAPATSANSGGVSSAPAGVGETRECAGCGKPITERFLLKALDLFWHEDCLKCGCCDCRLGEVGSTLYTKANLILCKRDYLRLFGTTGYCAACSKVIPAFEMVMRAKSNVYHLECFACQQCNHRFCVGDRFYLCDNKILCEYDYEERLVFANMAYNPSSLAHIRRQVGNLQPSGDDMIGVGGANGIRGDVSSSPPYCPTLKDGVPVFCSGKTWSPASSRVERTSSSAAGGAAATAMVAHVSGDEEASSGYGSPDSQPECTTLPVGSP